MPTTLDVLTIASFSWTPSPMKPCPHSWRGWEFPWARSTTFFFNANLLATRTKMAAFMGLAQARANLSDWDLRPGG